MSRFVVSGALLLVLAATGPQLRLATASADPVIAAAGDIACDPLSAAYNGGNGSATACRQKSTSDLLVNGGYTAVLPLGDNQYYCGSLTAYKAVFDPTWGRVKPILHPTTGNHEYLTSGSSNGATGCNSTNANAAGYFNYFGAVGGEQGKGYYSFDFGGWHLIALNSQCSHVGGCGGGSPQYTWLQNDLAAHADQCILAYWHIPLFSSGGLTSSAVKAFWQLLYAAHADVILNGHDHIYERFLPQDPNGDVDAANGIREFVVGTGGDNHGLFKTNATNEALRDNTSFGVLALTLHQGSYDWNFVPAPGTGTFTDSGSASCHAGSVGTDTTPPSVPTGLTANAVSSSEVDLSWTASSDNAGGSGVAGYKLYRSDHGSTPIATVTGTSYDDTGLAAGTTYTYTVSAVDEAGNESAQSQSVSATTSGGGGGGTVQLVQQKTLGATGVASLQMPLPAASGAGHALVAAVAVATGSSASVISVTDSAGSTWTKGPVGFLTGSNTRVEMWYRLGAPSLTSVTVTLSAAKSVAVNVSEWSGVGSSVDVLASGNGPSSTTVQTPLVSTSNASDLVIGAVNFPASATSTLGGGAFTGLNDFNASTSVHGRAAYAVTSSTGSFRATWTLTALSGGYGGAILALNAG